MSSEPEITGIDGTTRKAHYGAGRQPWDDIKDLGWGAEFAAGNALKYVRRHKAKNGADDLAKGRWYFAELTKLALAKARATQVLHELLGAITPEERKLLDPEGRCP